MFKFEFYQCRPTNHANHDADLRVIILLFCECGHYDKINMPFMAALNLVSITSLTR